MHETRADTQNEKVMMFEDKRVVSFNCNGPSFHAIRWRGQTVRCSHRQLKEERLSFTPQERGKIARLLVLSFASSCVRPRFENSTYV